MRIYRIVPDVDSYQSLLPADSSVAETGLMAFNGSSKIVKWPDPLVAVLDNEDLPKPDIFDISVSNLVLYGKSWILLEKELSRYCEFLPVKWFGNSGFVVNVLGLSNCLDAERTKWILGKESGKRLRIEKFEFHEDRLPTQLIFKIPERCFQLFCGQQFKEFIETHQINGLKFVEVWSNDVAA